MSLYNYANVKQRDNDIRGKNSFLYGKFGMVTLPIGLNGTNFVWLTDTGESYYRDFDYTSNASYAMKSGFKHLITNKLLSEQEINRMMPNIDGHNEYVYFRLSTGCEICGLLRFKKADFINLPSEKVPEFVSYNFNHYLIATNMIINMKSSNDSMLSKIILQINRQLVPLIDFKTMEIATKNAPNPPIHWVWFRRDKRKMSREISVRALSWMIINPDSEFNLWTDIKDKEELDEFMELLEPHIRQMYLDKLIVHYNSDTLKIVEDVFEDYKNSEFYDKDSYELLNGEFQSNYKNSMIYKTDVLRLMILYKYGGVYVDFNDCLSMSPIKQAIALYKNNPLGVTDVNDANHASNYFLYAPKLCPKWRNWTFEIMTDSKHIISLIKNEQIKIEVKKFCTNLLDILDQSFNNNGPGSSPIKTFFDKYENPSNGTSFKHINEMHIDLMNKVPYMKSFSRINDRLWTSFFLRILKESFEDSDNKKICDTFRIYSDKSSSKRRPNQNRAKETNLDGLKLNATFREEFEKGYDRAFLFWWTDYLLNTIMHFTNLPIYCRMKQYDLTLLPYGYYTRYGCIMSYVCHLGDGGSYGDIRHNPLTAEYVYGDPK